MMIVTKKLRDCHWMRWWRLVGFFIIFGLGFAANIPVYNSSFLADFGPPLQCIWDMLPEHYATGNIAQMAITSIFLIWGFGAIMRDTWPEFGEFIRELLTPVLRFLDPVIQLFSPRKWHYFTRRKLAEARQAGARRNSWWIPNSISFIIFLLYFTVIQIIFSSLFDLYRIWVTLFYITSQVIDIRIQAANALTADGNPAMIGSENTWGFGQILPMLLLALPISQVWEMVFGKSDFIFVLHPKQC
jgi:hypothetical protein